MSTFLTVLLWVAVIGAVACWLRMLCVAINDFPDPEDW